MNGRLLTVAAVAALLGAGLAGCVSEAPAAVEPSDLGPAAPPSGPHAVVALIDTGINPYHVDFRDASPLALVHPSAYLPGYPADAVPVNLTLDAPDLEAALEADAQKWKDLKPGVLYWFVGTKVSGYAPDDSAADPSVGLVFSTGHGSMTASRAAGNGHSLCPECRIVAVQGFSGEAVAWASQQPWIDVQSNSWSPLVVFQQADAVPVAGQPGLAATFEAAAARHAVFASAGNGVAGKGGVLGHPSFTRSTSGPMGVFSVGGHDNGEVVLWSGSWPHVVADACDNWAVAGDTMDEYGPREGGGTSSASPYAAGEAARLVLEARRVLNSTGGVADGVFARGNASVAEGPLADGDLTLDELRQLVLRTAVARPVKTEHDGESCGATGTPYTTYPVAWSSVPADVPSYALIGYGQVSVDSLASAVAALRGEAPLPERPLEDEWHAYADALREAYNGLPRG